MNGDDPQRLAIYAALRDSEGKAWEALSGYKFWMFGYHAARWVNYNQLLPPKLRFRSPFKSLVETGARQVDKQPSPAGGEGKPEPDGLDERISNAFAAATKVGPWQPLSRSGDSALVEAIGLLQLAATYLPITPLADKIADRIDKFIQQHGERK